MLLISALALGLVETTNSNIGNSVGGGFNVAGGNGVGVGSNGIGSISSSNAAGISTDTVISSMPSTGIGGGSHTEGHGSAGSGGSGGTSIAYTTNAIGSSPASGTITWDNNGTLRSASPGDWSIEQCLIWQRPHHLYFQLGNAFFFLALLAPHGSVGMLWLRALMIIACILMGMYGYLIECTPDVVLWSGLLLGVNFIYLIVVLCRLRPVRFDKEIEAVS